LEKLLLFDTNVPPNSSKPRNLSFKFPICALTSSSLSIVGFSSLNFDCDLIAFNIHSDRIVILLHNACNCNFSLSSNSIRQCQNIASSSKKRSCRKHLRRTHTYSIESQTHWNVSEEENTKRAVSESDSLTRKKQIDRGNGDGELGDTHERERGMWNNKLRNQNQSTVKVYYYFN